MTKVVFSTCWYEFKAKFDPSVYYKWMDTLLSTVENYDLVIYTDEASKKNLMRYCNNPRIKLVIKETTDFYMYKYKDLFEKNHSKNIYLNDMVDWRVNMLWCEKIFFVRHTIHEEIFLNKSFEDVFYGWIDIGYFREPYLLYNKELLKKWPNTNTISQLDKTKIYYSLVNPDDKFLGYLQGLILNKNQRGLPIQEIPPLQVSIGGGFFLTHLKNVEWWATTFETRLKLYFDNDYLVKDDQMIIADCVFSDMDKFSLVRENNQNYDCWFVFTRALA